MNEEVKSAVTNLQGAIDSLIIAIGKLELSAEEIEKLSFYNADGIANGLVDVSDNLRIVVENIVSTKNIVVEGMK